MPNESLRAKRSNDNTGRFFLHVCVDPTVSGTKEELIKSGGFSFFGRPKLPSSNFAWLFIMLSSLEDLQDPFALNLFFQPLKRALQRFVFAH